MHVIVLMGHFNMLCTLAFGCKFGIAPPFKYDEKPSSLTFEVEELRCENVGERNVYRKVIKKSPLAELVAERCKQLEIEEENMKKLMNNFRFETKESRKVRLRMEKKRDKEERYRKKKEREARVNGKFVDAVEATTEGLAQEEREAAAAAAAAVAKAEAAAAAAEAKAKAKAEVEAQAKADVIDKCTPSTSGHANVLRTKIDKINIPNSEEMWKENNYDKYIIEPEFCYVDFVKHQNDSKMHVSTFRMQDFDWDEQAFSTVNMLYPESAIYLDEKFKVGYNLTYYT